LNWIELNWIELKDMPTGERTDRWQETGASFCSIVEHQLETFDNERRAGVDDSVTVNVVSRLLHLSAAALTFLVRQQGHVSVTSVLVERVFVQFSQLVSSVLFE